MKRINKPIIDIGSVLNDCLDNMADKSLKKEILSSISKFIDAAEDYEFKKQKNELYKILQNQIISNSINSEVLKKLYTDRLVNKKSKGRQFYDAIISSAPKGICPFCSQRIVSTLDHYLPKSKYPIYSITPINLVPSCFDCNKNKLIDFPTSSENETLHPYYDNVEEENWLSMEITAYNPIAVSYYVSPHTKWSTVVNKRIEAHFISYNLNILYSIHAIEELSSIHWQLKNIFDSGGSASLKLHLKDCFNSRFRTNKNSWQSAFYKCLANDDKFTDEFFTQ